MSKVQQKLNQNMTISMQEDEYENVVKVLLHIYAHAKRRKAIT